MGVRQLRILRNFHSVGTISASKACFKLFVGGLSYDTNETVLRDAFLQYGDVVEVKVICDHMNGKSKGYGFVKLSSEADAITALTQMDGQKYSCAASKQGVNLYPLSEKFKGYFNLILRINEMKQYDDREENENQTRSGFRSLRRFYKPGVHVNRDHCIVSFL